MTVIIGLMCSDGGILASDSQATDLKAFIRVEVEKIFPLGSNIVWGVSGPKGLQQVLKESLDATVKKTWPEKTLSQIRTAIVDKVTGRQREALNQYVPVGGSQPPNAEALFCGFTADKWLLEIAENGQQEHHSEFCAVGSGKKTAYHCWATLKHYRPCEESMGLGKLIAFRIVHDVIETDAALVGFPIRMWTVGKDGVSQLLEPEIDALGELANAWKDEERLSLRRVLEGRGEAATE